jgi:hypothetical protein
MKPERHLPVTTEATAEPQKLKRELPAIATISKSSNRTDFFPGGNYSKWQQQ